MIFLIPNFREEGVFQRNQSIDPTPVTGQLPYLTARRVTSINAPFNSTPRYGHLSTRQFTNRDLAAHFRMRAGSAATIHRSSVPPGYVGPTK